MVSADIDSTELIDCKVFRGSGECLGHIDELLIDPFSGIVKSLILADQYGDKFVLPWSAILYDKTRRNFMLSPVGDSVLRMHRRPSSPPVTLVP